MVRDNIYYSLFGSIHNQVYSSFVVAMTTSTPSSPTTHASNLDEDKLLTNKELHKVSMLYRV